MTKILGRLGWRGQCSCCNGPKDKKLVRQEEKKQWKKEYQEQTNSTKQT